MEAAHLINRDTDLVGISSKPVTAPGGARRADVAVIMFNAGYLHHVGPNRINTSLARALTDSGFHTLRMDFSGLGDSGANPHARDNVELVNHDGKAAMDFMQATYGCTEFVLFGLCSGALDSIHIARNDKRVTGVVAVDGFGFRTKRFYFHHVASHVVPRLFRRQHLKRGLERGLPKLKSRLFGTSDSRPAAVAYAIANDGSFSNKTRQEAAEILQSLSHDRTKMRFIYTGGVSNYYNYANQFKDMFGNNSLGKKISWRYFPEADHLFMLANHRNQLLDDAHQWICREFS